MSLAPAPAIEAYLLKRLGQELVSEFHSDEFCCSITMMKEAPWPHSHHLKKKIKEKEKNP